MIFWAGSSQNPECQPLKNPFSLLAKLQRYFERCRLRLSECRAGRVHWERDGQGEVASRLKPKESASVNENWGTSDYEAGPSRVRGCILNVSL